MNKYDKPVFLLGGRDLEMEEIRNVLESEGYEEGKHFFDNGLSWGAKLSDYKDKLNKFTTYYAIELTIDLEGYDNVKIIDHHGELSDNDASLLQVLKILGKIPTRDQELIAANDARYIEGMKCMGATHSEIFDIRKRDRQTQGITDKDESLARKDASTKRLLYDINLIKAHTSFFSAVMDSLYFNIAKDEKKDKTIIYNDKKIVFYGFNIVSIKEVFETFNLTETQYYSGGGENGYIGIVEDKISSYVLKKIRINVLCKSKPQKERPLYSSHIFMFPFRFDYAKEPINKNGKNHEYEFYYEKDIQERINLENIKDKLEKQHWHYETYDTHNDICQMHLAYNEFAYFYDYAKDSLYNREEFNKDAISSFFRKGIKIKDADNKEKIEDYYKGKTYKIAVQAIGCKDKITYELEIEGVSLRIFHTGIAILSIELSNHHYSAFDDILRINDFGRRVYPQYIGTNFELATKQSFLADFIQVADEPKEDFKDFNYKDIEIGKHIMQVLGTELFTDKKKLKKDDTKFERFYIQPSLDDRMFVMSWYGNDEFSSKLIKNYSYKESDEWYKYVFVDGGNDATVQNNLMKATLLQESTYDRWTSSPYYETLFGITRYSFVCLSKNSYFTKNILPRPHMNTMYFQMATLLLANRTSILRFSDEIAALVSPTQKQKDNTSIEKHTKKLEKLYDIYLKYYNRLYFKEVTHQDQGIELYNIGIEQMRISNHVDKLDGKFEKLFNFMSLKAEKKSSKAINALTYFGGVFVLPTFVLSLFNLDEVKEFFTTPHIYWVGLSAIIGLIIAYKLIHKGEK